MYFLLPVHRSPIPCGKAGSATLAKATICIYSQVAVHLAHAVRFFLKTLFNIGLGLGSVLSRASVVTDSMVEASSFGLADSLTQDERDSDLLYPRLERIREISAFIATRVIRKAQEEVSNQFSHSYDRTYPRIRVWTEIAICAR